MTRETWRAQLPASVASNEALLCDLEAATFEDGIWESEEVEGEWRSRRHCWWREDVPAGDQAAGVLAAGIRARRILVQALVKAERASLAVSLGYPLHALDGSELPALTAALAGYRAIAEGKLREWESARRSRGRHRPRSRAHAIAADLDTLFRRHRVDYTRSAFLQTLRTVLEALRVYPLGKVPAAADLHRYLPRGVAGRKSRGNL